ARTAVGHRRLDHDGRLAAVRTVGAGAHRGVGLVVTGRRGGEDLDLVVRGEADDVGVEEAGPLLVVAVVLRRGVHRPEGPRGRADGHDLRRVGVHAVALVRHHDRLLTGQLAAVAGVGVDHVDDAGV